MEVKTFGELSLYDRIYIVTKEDFNSHEIERIQIDPDDSDLVQIELDDSSDLLIFPDNESVYEDKESNIKYTTDKKQYMEWQIPFTEKLIADKEKRIEIIKLEIEELRNSIPKK